VKARARLGSKQETPLKFDTKVVIAVHEDLAAWQKLNMTLFSS
jgi:hypothetical protein